MGVGGQMAVTCVGLAQRAERRESSSTAWRSPQRNGPDFRPRKMAETYDETYPLKILDGQIQRYLNLNGALYLDTW